MERLFQEQDDFTRAESSERCALERLDAAEVNKQILGESGPRRGHKQNALTFERAPKEGTLCSLVHLPLTPFDHPLDPHTLLRSEHHWPAGATEKTYSLTGRYGQGSRVFIAVEVQSAALGCPLRLLAERRVIE